MKLVIFMLVWLVMAFQAALTTGAAASAMEDEQWRNHGWWGRHQRLGRIASNGFGSSLHDPQWVMVVVLICDAFLAFVLVWAILLAVGVVSAG